MMSAHGVHSKVSFSPQVNPLRWGVASVLLTTAFCAAVTMAGSVAAAASPRHEAFAAGDHARSQGTLPFLMPGPDPRPSFRITAPSRAVRAVPLPARAPATVPARPPASAGNYGQPPAAFTACVIRRESGGDPTAYNASSGASGLFGFLLSTWDGLGIGYPGGAYTAPAGVQYQGFYKLYAEAGAAPWSGYDGCQA